eukprot:TRINITY_DN9397_c0_g1_i1.p1 TRINITY_DN9397_c0_g1~~TRINITY_DN9397_c0_g1_i1.p1  ORF type:complete len:330 (+),score=66.04 TRINITY_DN9397_c0_g1_i1:47-1036(+)
MSKPKIFVCSRIKWFNLGDEILNKYEIVQKNNTEISREEFLTQLKDTDALLLIGHNAVNKMDKESLDIATRLKIISNHGAGYDPVDVKYAEEKGVWVTNTPNLVNSSTANIAVTLLLMTTRRVKESMQHIEKKKKFGFAWNHFHGHDLDGKTLGLLGLGGIGKTVVKRLSGFDMKFIYHNRNRLPPEEEKKLNVTYVSRDELWKQSDFISIHIPLSNETKHSITKEDFDKMKNGVIIINTARGYVLKQDDLKAALKSGKVGGAGLDVLEKEGDEPVDEELLHMPNVTITPHIGTTTVETRTEMEKLSFENIFKVFNGEHPLTPVNKPNK